MSLKSSQGFFSNSIAFFKANGAKEFAKKSAYRLANAWHEQRLGIRSAGFIKPSELGFEEGDSHEYVPMGYTAIISALSYVPIPEPDVSFIDYGSGMGRAVAVAASFAFKNVRGVELSDHLNDVAKHNVARMRFRKAQQVELIRADAAEFALPTDVNVIYFWNPFGGETLRRTVGNILTSYRNSPRCMYVLYFNKDRFDALIAEPAFRGIKLLRESSFYPNYSFGLYSISAT